MVIDDDFCIICFVEKFVDFFCIFNRFDYSLVLMGIYIFNMDVLKKVLIEDVEIE